MCALKVCFLAPGGVPLTYRHPGNIPVTVPYDSRTPTLVYVLESMVRHERARVANGRALRGGGGGGGGRRQEDGNHVHRFLTHLPRAPTVFLSPLSLFFRTVT